MFIAYTKKGPIKEYEGWVGSLPSDKRDSEEDEQTIPDGSLIGEDE